MSSALSSFKMNFLCQSHDVDKCLLIWEFNTYEKPLKYQNFTSSFFIRELLSIADIACASSCPVDVAALHATPILRTKM